MSTLLVLSAVGNAGKKGSIVVIHHTDCGLATASDEEIKKVLLGSVNHGDSGVVESIMREMKFGSIEM